MSDAPALPLGYAEQRNPPPRPTLADPGIERAAVLELLPRIIRWMGKDWREAEREEVIDDLVSVIHESDGYQAARALENHSHWEGNAALVDILDDSYGCILNAHRKAAHAWVEANLPRPIFSVGQLVKTIYGTGPIVRIDEKEAAYTVQTDCFLKEHPGQTGETGFIVAFEKCEAAS